MNAPIAFSNSYARLPERFFARVDPSAAREPRLIRINHPLALELGLDPAWLESPSGLDFLSGRAMPTGAEPLAMAYAGHQFGGFVPQLGDGRAILLGEVVDPSGRRRDIQLKGSGLTPFSRRGDGRAALGPVLREYVVSEAMAALGIPTTRALSAVTTGEMVERETPLPGAMLARVAASHIRVGTFQFFAARNDVEGLRLLADHVIARHYPDAAEAGEDRYRALLAAVVAAQADLIARWLGVGFIHGVMNTDNMSVAGETIDYGPCAFMDAYDPGAVFSSIDRQGRYAFANQPRSAHWNLARLAETLLPLLASEPEPAIKIAEEVLDLFAPRFEAAFHAGLRRKIGLAGEQAGDADLVLNLMKLMADNGADFTLTFRRLGNVAGDSAGEPGLAALFIDQAALAAWLARWRQRLAAEPREPLARAAAMHAVNPRYIPRNHRVEAMIQAAVQNGDYAPFEELLTVLARPFDDQPGFAHYEEPPAEHERVRATFCGT